MTDNREYRTFYGVYLDDWSKTWGTLANNHFFLVTDYFPVDVSTVSSTGWGSTTTIFLYQQNIKKKYIIEGVAYGQLTFCAPASNSFVSDYRVTLMQINSSGSNTEIASTGVITINDSITTAIYSIVYPFWITIYDSPKEMGENDLLGLKVQWNVVGGSGVTAKLSHWNDNQYEDLKIAIPIIRE